MNYNNYFEYVADGKWREYRLGEKHNEYTETKRYNNGDGLAVELTRVYKMYLMLTPWAAYQAESLNFGGRFLTGSWTYDTIKSTRK